METADLPVWPDRSFEGLRSERLLVRRVRDEDAASLAAYRSDPEVARYQGWETPMSLDQARRFVRGMADDHPDTPGEWFQYAIEVLETGEHIGDLASHTHGDDPRIMDTLIDILSWLAIATATTALVWLYGASWRAVAKALSEATHQSTHDATTPSTVPTPTAPLSSNATAGRDNMHVGASP